MQCTMMTKVIFLGCPKITRSFSCKFTSQPRLLLWLPVKGKIPLAAEQQRSLQRSKNTTLTEYNFPLKGKISYLKQQNFY